MSMREGILWVIVCIAGCMGIQWCDLCAGLDVADLRYWSEAAVVGMLLGLMTWARAAPLRWFVLAFCIVYAAWPRWDVLTGAPLVPLEEVMAMVPLWTHGLWLLAGAVGGWLYALPRRKTWEGEGWDDWNTTHCLAWGALIGPPLLAVGAWSWCAAWRAARREQRLREELDRFFFTDAPTNRIGWWFDLNR